MKRSTIDLNEVVTGNKIPKDLSKEIDSSKKKVNDSRASLKIVKEKLIKANHLYSFISHINQTISKVQNEADLFDASCKIAVKNGNFKMAWLGLTNINEKKINLVSSSGVSKSTIKALVNKTYDADGPTENVIKGDSYYVINDLSKDTDISWSKFALLKGLKSSITLAIKKNKQTIACFYVYSTELNFFDKDEINMLLEVAHDLSFCIDNIEIAKQHRLAELENSKVTQDLMQRNRDLEQFTYIVSHNLRAPLANIIGISSFLSSEESKPKESKEFIKGLNVSANVLDSVLKDLNTILQVKRNIDDKKELIYFSKIVDEISHSISELIDSNHVTIIRRFVAAKKIFSIRAYIYSIFYNLIINSIKYSQPNLDPIIEIVIKNEKGRTILKFKDNGLGFDLKINSDKIFGLYNRFHKHVEGKGMGMFMTKSQVEALGGTIAIESEPLKGTTITIII